MPRPRELIEPKKTERLTVNLPEVEAAQVYRLAAEMGIPPAVLLRIWVRAALLSSSNKDAT